MTTPDDRPAVPDESAIHDALREVDDPEAGMNIVELGKYYTPHFGGVELVTELSAKALAEQHGVVVVCFNDGPGERCEVCDGVPVVRLGAEATILRQGISLGLARRLRALIATGPLHRTRAQSS